MVFNFWKFGIYLNVSKMLERKFEKNLKIDRITFFASFGEFFHRRETASIFIKTIEKRSFFSNFEIQEFFVGFEKEFLTDFALCEYIHIFPIERSRSKSRFNETHDTNLVYSVFFVNRSRSVLCVH